MGNRMVANGGEVGRSGSGPMRCALIGADTLLIECAEMLLARGHHVVVVAAGSDRVASWATGRGIPVVHAVGPAESWAGPLIAHDVEVAFAITHLAVLPAEILRWPTVAAVNFHDGPLPAHAGLNAPMWALLQGETTYGISWHLITEGVDEGDLLLQRTFEVSDRETALSLNTRNFEAAIESFATLVDDLAAGRAVRSPQEPSAARQVHRRRDRPASMCVIDWRRPAAEIDRLVRALDVGPYANPLGRATLLHDGWAMSVTHSQVHTDVRGVPGEILAVGEQELVVRCGDTAVGLSGLTTLDGVGVPVAVAAAQRGWAPGRRLDLLDDERVAELTELGQRLAAHEPGHHARLLRFEPAPLPWAGVAGPGHIAHHDAVAVPLPAACRERSTDPTAAVVAAFAVLISRLTGRSSVHLGASDAAIVADRSRGGPLVAPWVPLALEVDLAAPFAAATDAVTAALAEMASRGAMVADLVAREPDLARRAAAGGLVKPLGLRLDGGEGLVAGSTAELVRQDDGQWWFRFDAALLERRDAELCVDCLTSVLAAGAMDPGMVASEIDVLGDQIRHEVLEAWNDTATAVPAGECIHHLFEAQADRTPLTPAVVFEDRALTYAELDARANQLGAHLRALGIGPDSLVGIHVERGLDLMVCVLGVLKAGGAYVPLDPTYPDDRLRHMIADSGATVILTQQRLERSLPLPPGSDAHVVRVDADWPAIARCPAERVRAATTPEHLAYCIYTSGSTGLPKGVLVEHRNVVSFFTGMDARVAHDLPATWFAVTSLSFDISVLELLYTTARGFTVVVHLDRERGDDGLAGHAGAAPRPIDFSLFYFNGDEAEHTGPDKYRLLLDGARWADQHDFVAVWTPERHFHAFGGLYPQPAVTGAAVAAVTERVAIRAGSVVLPLNHPIRVAEAWSVVDNLSNGRVGLGIAAGWHPDDFVLMPDGYADPKQRMFRDIDVVRRLWRGEEVSFPGPGGREPAVRTLPRPVQPEVPIWVTTAGNPETYVQAGAIGANLLTHLLGQSVEQLAPKVAAYRQARADAGFDPATGIVSVMLHTFVGDDEDRVRELVREPLKAYLATALSLVKDDAWVFPAFKRPPGVEPPAGNELAHLGPEEVDAILEHGFVRYYETSGLFGTPERAMSMVERMRAIGVDEIACLIDFGVSSNVVLEHLPHLGELQRRANARTRPAPVAATEQSVAAQLRRHGVTHLQCTPSMARMFTLQDDTRAALAEVAHVYVGGEALPAALAGELAGLVRSGDVTNMYGPTETTIWSTTWKVRAPLESVPIGTPIANTRVYVLDQHLEPVPPGVPGELWIGGDGVVRGYHRRPELTAERFVADPFRPGGARMYRTGDLARWRRQADGTAVLEFLGRVDHQVKVRGYRIELGEIEARLGQHPAVRECVVVVRADAAGDGELVAFVSARHGSRPDVAELKDHLRVTLPPPMVPAHVVVLDDLPHTPNGKIDRRALPELGEVTGRPAGRPAPAENDLERLVLDAWHQTLANTSIGVDDNFFDAGGHSLLVVRLQRRLNECLSAPVPLTELYRYPTVRSFVASLTDERAASGAQQGLDRAARRRESMSRRRAR
jgi:natural product biosynthesis luciferase-like monooxygenase protein